ncbi:MAG: alpha/beta hydrolase, partial [Sphingomonadales bacterium]
MPRVRANDITFEYERSGPETGEPLLLIHGVGAQLTQWPPEYVSA